MREVVGIATGMEVPLGVEREDEATRAGGGRQQGPVAVLGEAPELDRSPFPAGDRRRTGRAVVASELERRLDALLARGEQHVRVVPSGLVAEDERRAVAESAFRMPRLVRRPPPSYERHDFDAASLGSAQLADDPPNDQRVARPPSWVAAGHDAFDPTAPPGDDSSVG